MALQTSGSISLTQIQAELGGSDPISMTEYYRTGVYTTLNNSNVPTTGSITMSSAFYGAVKAITVLYEIIGGGGGGGLGYVNSDSGYGSYGERHAGDPGGASTLVSTGNIAGGSGLSISAAGGSGGASLNGITSGYGAGTVYGAGGVGGANSNSTNQRPGWIPAADAWGAGGGGGGARPFPGYGGLGGGAGTLQTGTVLMTPGQTLNVTIGGAGWAWNYDVRSSWLCTGAPGIHGYAKLTIDGVVYEYTSSGSIAI